MKYNQSRLSTKISFNFESEELQYSLVDNNSNLSFEVPYEKIPKRSQIFYEKNLWLRNVGYIWVALGAVLTVMNFVGEGPNRMSFWVWIGLGCLAFYKFTQSEYTYYDTEDGRILVLKDNQSSEILTQIKDRRKKAYMNWFHTRHFENKRQIEQTLDYLVTEKVLSKEEAATKLEGMISDTKNLLLEKRSSNDDTPLH